MTGKVPIHAAGQVLTLDLFDDLFDHLSEELTIVSLHDSHWNLKDPECAWRGLVPR